MKNMSNKGFSFVELLVAGSILGITSLLVLNLVSLSSEKVGDVNQELNLSNMIAGFSQEIRKNIHLYQFSHNFDDIGRDDDFYLNNIEFTMGWRTSRDISGSQDLIPIGDCLNSCSGKMGFRILPLNGYTGLFTVYLVYEETSISKGKKLIKFMVKGK